ncbi:hypothetical protein ZWY2020_030901 [Hordeum vulgare]|nr:hypothetical protein ZWY2020_030901 [Hordeum vulgare]
MPSEAKSPEAGGLVICEIAGTDLSADRRVETESDLLADASTDEGDSHRRWKISYVDTDRVSGAKRPGFIYLHKGSRWITVRDDEHDILAGKYLQQRENSKVGDELEIDGFRVSVRSLWTPRKVDYEPAKVCDITIDSTRFGGRSWLTRTNKMKMRLR